MEVKKVKDETNLSRKLFTTSNFELASALNLYTPVLSVVAEKDRPIYLKDISVEALFIFIRSDMLDNLVKKFKKKKLEVEVNSYTRSMYSLEAELYL